MQYILTIDQSTTATKALMIDLDGNIIETVSKKHKQIYPQKGWVEHNPNEIMNNVYLLLKKLIDRNEKKKDHIIALSITNQRETTIVWDRNTGLPVHNAIVWQCRRTSKHCEQLKEKEKIIAKKTGLKIDPYFSATKIKWIFDTYNLEPEKYMFGTIDSWLIYNLTNRKMHVCDHTNASRTLLYNLKKKSWDQDLLDIFGISMNILPVIKCSDDIFGYTTLNGQLKEIPIVGVIGDSQASLFAQHCFEKGQTKATIGTGSSVLMNTGEKVLDNVFGIVNTLGWNLKKDKVYASEAIIHSSADTLNWMRDQLGLFKDDSELNEICETYDANGVIVVPAFVGLGNPYWLSDAKASIQGISRNTDKFNVICAGVESIAFQIYDAIEELMNMANTIVPTIYIDGGGIQNPYLMQLIADLCKSKVIINEEMLLSALGSYYIAMLGLKLKDKSEIQTMKKEVVTFTPSMDEKVRIEKINMWKNAIKTTVYSVKKAGN